MNVLMTGVGGQGVLMASEVLALAALAEGLEAKQSEVHGVAQRGGSVVSHVRFGPRVRSPLIRCGEVDFLYAAERLEALRYAHYLKPGGAVIMNDHAIHPIEMPGAGETEYPEGVSGFLSRKGYEVLLVPALEEAVELGNKQCANIILLGALSTRLDLKEESWQSALEKRFPSRFLKLNQQAIGIGQQLVGLPL